MHRMRALEIASLNKYLPPEEQPEDPMATTNPLQFIQQVRAEVSKVTWPTRREVLITSVMVFIMAMLTAIFFFFVDWLIRQGLAAILGMF